MRVKAQSSATAEQARQRPLLKAIPDEQLDLLVAREQIAELEGSLDSARQGLLTLQTQNQSLQSSLGLIVGENSRLFHRLTESNALLDKAHSENAQMKTALSAAEAERDELAAALDAANQKLQLQNSLQEKERQVQEFDQSRAKLIEGANTLLKIVTTRDRALDRAEERMKLLAEQVAQLKADVDLARIQGKMEELKLQLRSESAEAAVTENAGREAHAICAELLAATITFVNAA
jgi:chromosome segregation ATPase